MRLAMKRPQVLAYLKLERRAVVARITAQNPHRLQQLRDQDDNRAAAVQAARAIEGLGNDPGFIGADGRQRAGWAIDLSEPSPGVVIVIKPRPSEPPPTRPMIRVSEIEHDPTPPMQGDNDGL